MLHNHQQAVLLIIGWSGGHENGNTMKLQHSAEGRRNFDQKKFLPFVIMAMFLSIRNFMPINEKVLKFIFGWVRALNDVVNK